MEGVTPHRATIRPTASNRQQDTLRRATRRREAKATPATALRLAAATLPSSPTKATRHQGSTVNTVHRVPTGCRRRDTLDTTSPEGTPVTRAALLAVHLPRKLPLDSSPHRLNSSHLQVRVAPHRLRRPLAPRPRPSSEQRREREAKAG